jgi:tRNA uridine 5-carbamoylmethylation protein Kti12
MPLVIITGRPSTGKTRVAQALADHFRTTMADHAVVLLNDESLGTSKRSGYASKPMLTGRSAIIEHFLCLWVQLPVTRR